MKMWISFSSNHSSSYVVMGSFKTVELAKKAAKAIDDKIKAMREEERNWPGYNGSGYQDRKWVYEKHGIDGGDWEDDPSVNVSGSSVRIWLNTAGYGLDDLAKLLKKEGATRTEVMTEDESEDY